LERVTCGYKGHYCVYLAQQFVLFPNIDFHVIYVQVSDAQFLPNQNRCKQLVSKTATLLPKSGVCLHDQFDVSLWDLSQCRFLPPLAEPGVSSFLKPA
jgi:hypothetical protein